MITREADFKHFFQSSMWKDMKGFLQRELEKARDQLETEVDVDKIRILQGQCKANRDLLDIEGNIDNIYIMERMANNAS